MKSCNEFKFFYLHTYLRLFVIVCTYTYKEKIGRFLLYQFLSSLDLYQFRYILEKMYMILF